jgi:hypothetical protein
LTHGIYVVPEDSEIFFSSGVFSCINPNHPVRYVSWYGSVAFCDWLSLQQGLTRAYSHANWQCNGTYPYSGCLSGPYPGWTVPVGSYPANAFGLYDIHGNLWERCNDRYGTYGGTVTDPVGPTTGSTRVYRGGNFYAAAVYCRSAFRSSSTQISSEVWTGFRPVRTANCPASPPMNPQSPDSRVAVGALACADAATPPSPGFSPWRTLAPAHPGGPRPLKPRSPFANLPVR